MLEQAITNGASAQPIELGQVHNHRSTADPDAPLLDALRLRNATAFYELVKRYERRLLNVALRITKNREDAEEVVQDSFLKVFKHLDSFRGNSQFASWLTRITINQALMKVRGNTRKFVSIDTGEGAEDAVVLRDIRACGYTPEQFCSQREFEDVVLNFATTVRKSARQVMELYIEKDLSEVEIAQVLGLSLSAVKARLYRGRLDLREVLGRLFPPAKLPPVRVSPTRKTASAETTSTRNHEETPALEYVLLPGALCAESSAIYASI